MNTGLPVRIEGASFVEDLQHLSAWMQRMCQRWWGTAVQGVGFFWWLRWSGALHVMTHRGFCI